MTTLATSNIPQPGVFGKLARVALALLLGLSFSPVVSYGCGAAWSNEFAVAAHRSQMSEHPILIMFLGSDWDQMSQTLDREVLKNSNFGGYSKLNFVLLKADFPQEQLQPPDVQAANLQLAAKYQIKSFPTLVLVDSNGNELARTTYDGWTFDQFMARMDGITRKLQAAKANS